MKNKKIVLPTELPFTLVANDYLVFCNHQSKNKAIGCGLGCAGCSLMNFSPNETVVVEEKVGESKFILNFKGIQFPVHKSRLADWLIFESFVIAKKEKGSPDKSAPTEKPESL